jgi:hypothetical protein
MIKHRNAVLREKKRKTGAKSFFDPGFKDTEI